MTDCIYLGSAAWVLYAEPTQLSRVAVPLAWWVNYSELKIAEGSCSEKYCVRDISRALRDSDVVRRRHFFNTDVI